MNTSERLVKAMSTTLRRELTLGELQNVNLIESLGLNSIDALEILVCVEGEFGVEIHDSELSIELVSSFAKLEQFVNQRLAEMTKEPVPGEAG